MACLNCNEMEPEVKRQKLEAQSPVHIAAVLADEIEHDVPLQTVYTSKIQNKQQISIIMQELSHKLPLSTCQHLKRVRQKEIIICSADDLSAKSLEEFLKYNEIVPAVLQQLCVQVQQVQVAAAAPKLRWQYEALQKIWPCKFHPDKYLESLYAGNNFTDAQKQFHANIMHLLLNLSQQLEAGKPFGICVDPRTSAIVALATSRVDLNPLIHCPMVLTDLVARTQNAGAWNSRWQEDFMQDKEDESNVTLTGVHKRYFDFAQHHPKWRDIKFGAERLRTKDALSTVAADNLTKYGPYLCTGYDIYLSEEPCLMCAMALVHSRVRRIFFARRSPGNGALISRFKLHTVKELNHHYEVFQCHIDKENKS